MESKIPTTTPSHTNAKTLSAKKKCFVIMPFSQTTKDHTDEYWNNHYTYFLEPLIKELQLDVHRSSPLRTDVLRQIIFDLITSDIVVADVTDQNPNVYWELGVRQSFKNGTVTIKQDDGTSLPFDISTKATLSYYPGNHIKNAEFQRRFRAAVSDCLTNPKLPDSHVLETISGRGTLYDIIMKEQILRKLQAVLEEANHNLTLVNDIKERCENNRKIRENKDKGKQNFTTVTCRLLSSENLVVERYIDTDNSFYQQLTGYVSALSTVNDYILKWSDMPQRVEDWFCSAGFLPSLINTTEKIQSRIKNFQRVISSQI